MLKNILHAIFQGIEVSEEKLIEVQDEIRLNDENLIDLFLNKNTYTGQAAQILPILIDNQLPYLNRRAGDYNVPARRDMLSLLDGITLYRENIANFTVKDALLYENFDDSHNILSKELLKVGANPFAFTIPYRVRKKMPHDLSYFTCVVNTDNQEMMQHIISQNLDRLHLIYNVADVISDSDYAQQVSVLKEKEILSQQTFTKSKNNHYRSIKL